MKSVLWTEAMHVPVLLIGSAVLLFVGLDEIGGLDALLAANPDTMHLWRPLSTTAGDAGLSGISVRSQRDAVARRAADLAHHRPLVLVHRPVHRAARAVGAGSQGSAPRHASSRAYLKLAPVFIFLLPGMIAVALWKQSARASRRLARIRRARSRCWSPTCCPIGLRGLVLAGMLSALMSALASLFNSTATLFTVDFYKRLRPQSSEKHLVTVGRIATVRRWSSSA